MFLIWCLWSGFTFFLRCPWYNKELRTWKDEIHRPAMEETHISGHTNQFNSHGIAQQLFSKLKHFSPNAIYKMKRQDSFSFVSHFFNPLILVDLLVHEQNSVNSY